MYKFYVGLISFAVGCIFMYFAVLNSIKVTNIESKGEKINSALVTIDIKGKEIQYYMGEFKQ